MTAITYIDAEQAVRLWINSLTTTLVGPGGAIPKGAHLQRLRSPFRGAYVVLSTVGGTSELVPETPYHRARISGQVYGVTKGSAAVAAVAYANTVAAVKTPTAMGSVVCMFTAGHSGPIDLSDLDVEPRYVFDADFYFRPM